MTYQVISTGSSCNAYLVHGEILIDVGVSYKILTPYLENVKVILLTHIHGDHFKSDAISRIATPHPDITFICGEWLEPNLRRLNVSNFIIATQMANGSSYMIIYSIRLNYCTVTEMELYRIMVGELLKEIIKRYT
ncbi:hypothetical protein MGH68_14015 [Erysipelothrix sp. D19-032]